MTSMAAYSGTARIWSLPVANDLASFLPGCSNPGFLVGFGFNRRRWSTNSSPSSGCSSTSCRRRILCWAAVSSVDGVEPLGGQRLGAGMPAAPDPARRRLVASARTEEVMMNVPVEEEVGRMEEGVGRQLAQEGVEIEKLVRSVRSMLHSMGSCAISGSPYDAGWVAMVPAVDGSGWGPQFPAALDWVMRTQLPDGSWAGDSEVFNLYDRLACTLSCVLALTTWSRAPLSVKRGCKFVCKHLHEVEEDRRKVHRTVGFEVVFSAMVERAKGLGGLELPYDAPVMATIRRERDRKMKQIPLDRLMSEPSTLLGSLEGLEGLPGMDWNRVLKLASPTGHMLSSPASTACVFMQTGDPKMLEFLTRLVDEFQGGVPNQCPMDLFERLWVVDRLQRLGIARYFEKEIKDILDMAYQLLTPNGLSWASDCPVTDLDDTSMSFRLLRQHGYDVSPDVFHGFQKGDKFSCWIDHGSDLDGDLTPTFNLYRAAQTMFPGETLLEKAWTYTRSHLRENLQNKTMADKWVSAKDLQGEVEYALSFPWYASLPRIETRAYIDQYGVDDVWIAKTLYRMYTIQNPTFLSLAKADYNMCQRMYQKELKELQRWISDSGFDRIHFARHSTVLAGYLIMACCFFEPEMAAVRKAGTQVSVLITMIDDYITESGAPLEELHQFQAALERWDPSLIDHSNKPQWTVFMGVYNTINHIAAQAFVVQGRDVSNYIIQECRYWFQCALTRQEWVRKAIVPSWDEFLHIGSGSSGFHPVTIAPALVVPNHRLSDDVLQGDLHTLGVKGDLNLRLLNDIRSYQRGGVEVNAIVVYLRHHPDKTEEEAIAYVRRIADSTMQQLVQSALRPNAAPLPSTRIYLENAKMSYYIYTDKDGWSDPSAAMKKHIHQLLFQSIPL